MNLITPPIKDNVLRYLMNSDELPIDINYDELAQELSISPDMLGLIIEQFADMNLIKVTEYIGGSLVYITANAHDFICHGGFVVQEEILKSNIEKLGLELDLLARELEPKHLDRLEKISSLATNIVGVLKLFS
ncbi:hypothetical protein QVN81_10080 [Prevotella lascolaii]|nr:hypothetical protein [Leyella lascolaii]